jgi:hypothetical protein
MRVMRDHLTVDPVPQRHELLSDLVENGLINVRKSRTLDRQRAEITGVKGRNRHGALSFDGYLELPEDTNRLQSDS